MAKRKDYKDVHLIVSPGLKESIDEAAARNKKSINQWATRALKEKIIRELSTLPMPTSDYKDDPMVEVAGHIEHIRCQKTKKL